MTAAPSISGIVRDTVERLGQKQVATLLGVTPAAVYNWSIGRTRPARDKLPLLARVAGEPLARVEQAWANFNGGGPRLEKKLTRLENRESALRQEIEELRQELRRLLGAPLGPE